MRVVTIRLRNEPRTGDVGGRYAFPRGTAGFRRRRSWRPLRGDLRVAAYPSAIVTLRRGYLARLQAPREAARFRSIG
jgi:hypothetical protein